MDINEAVQRRHSIRAFKPDPVPKETLRQIMGLALRAPSWANTQPWKLAIASGEKLEEIKREYVRIADQPSNPDIPRTPGFPEPYATRRRALGMALFAARGIERDDEEKRRWWRLQGLQLFGAPCAIYIYVDRFFYQQGDNLNLWPLFDCGMIAESIMLLATNFGLGTIPQGQAVQYPDVLRRVLGLPDSALMVLGIAIGYPDTNDPVNTSPSVREPAEKLISWYGF